jgi:hypothetical protein
MLKDLENRDLRKVFGLKRVELIGVWRKLYENLNDV